MYNLVSHTHASTLEASVYLKGRQPWACKVSMTSNMKVGQPLAMEKHEKRVDSSELAEEIKERKRRHVQPDVTHTRLHVGSIGLLYKKQALGLH